MAAAASGNTGKYNNSCGGYGGFVCTKNYVADKRNGKVYGKYQRLKDGAQFWRLISKGYEKEMQRYRKEIIKKASEITFFETTCYHIYFEDDDEIEEEDDDDKHQLGEIVIVRDVLNDYDKIILKENDRLRNRIIEIDNKTSFLKLPYSSFWGNDCPLLTKACLKDLRKEFDNNIIDDSNNKKKNKELLYKKKELENDLISNILWERRHEENEIIKKNMKLLSMMMMMEDKKLEECEKIDDDIMIISDDEEKEEEITICQNETELGYLEMFF